MRDLAIYDAVAACAGGTSVPAPVRLHTPFRVIAPTLVVHPRGWPLALTTSAAGTCSLRLLDVTGRQVWTRELTVPQPGTTRVTIDVGTVRPGIYLLVARYGSDTTSQKVCFLADRRR